MASEEMTVTPKTVIEKFREFDIELTQAQADLILTFLRAIADTAIKNCNGNEKR